MPLPPESAGRSGPAVNADLSQGVAVAMIEPIRATEPRVLAHARSPGRSQKSTLFRNERGYCPLPRYLILTVGQLPPFLETALEAEPTSWI